jgi:hypothetical protein
MSCSTAEDSLKYLSIKIGVDISNACGVINKGHENVYTDLKTGLILLPVSIYNLKTEKARSREIMKKITKY